MSDTFSLEDFSTYLEDLHLKDADGEVIQMKEFTGEMLNKVFAQMEETPKTGIMLPLLQLMVHTLEYLDVSPEISYVCMGDEDVNALILTLTAAAFFFGSYCAQNKTTFEYIESKIPDPAPEV